MSIYNGKSISAYSPLPQESEILLSPNMRFIVTRECYTDGEYEYVDILQLSDDQDTFVF
jgi:hypothetical protein